MNKPMPKITASRVLTLISEIDLLTDDTILTEEACNTYALEIQALKVYIEEHSGEFENHSNLVNQCMLAEYFLQLRISEILERKYKEG